MKAAVWHNAKDVRIEDVPEPPSPERGQVQVEVLWCGICGTDLHEYTAGPLYIPVGSPHPLTGVEAPVIIGHEFSARVVAVGSGVTGFAIGDRIAACPIVGCGECRWCRTGSMAQCGKVAFVGTSWHGGGFAERLNLFAYQCFHLSGSVSDEAGAFVEPFSATVRALERAGVGPETSVGVVGAGPMGLMTLMAARILGAKQVVSVEVAARRKETAARSGATAVIDPQETDTVAEARKMTDGEGFDVVAECCGQPATGLLAGRLARTRGCVVVIGVFEKPAALDFTDLVYREKTLIGSMSGYGRFDAAIAMMEDSRFRGDLLITRRIPLGELVDRGFCALIEEKDKHVKILVSPQL